MDLRLAGKRALVTGSSSGIGEAIVSLLAAEGVAVVVHGRSVSRANAVAEAIRAGGGKAEVVLGDLTTDTGADAVADAALSGAIRDRAVPDSRLTGTANLLVMPNIDAANIAFNLLKAAADGLPVGPMLLGMSKPIHVLVPSVTARGIVNLSALAVAPR